MKSSHRYFPVNDAQRAWGIYATCVGHSQTEPGDEFPSPNHPDEYFFSWDKGRILNEWQLSLIEQGQGMVEFRHRKYTVHEGSLIVLPPGCWHRYRPQRNIGWTTMWIGFGGDLADRLVGGAGFDRHGCVWDIPNLHRFHRHLRETVTAILDEEQGSTYSTAARIPLLIAYLTEERNRSMSGESHAELIHRAQAYIAEHASEIIDFETLSSSLGIPYRTFRHIFSKETGTSPHQYQLDIRLARAKNLLRSSDMPISDIASALGFNSAWYFAHFFQRRVKMSAASFRKRVKATPC